MRPLKRFLLILGALALLGIPAGAQMTNTLYFMHGVPQSNRINPAFQPACGFYLGFPLLAPLRAQLASSSLAYNDVIYQHPLERDSLITFLHPLGSKETFLDQLKPVNFLSTGISTSLASMGFRTSVGFFSLDVATRVDASVYYPGDLLRLVINGSEDGQTHQLDGIGADLSVFDEVSVGWSRSFMDNLTMGVRAKVLFGMANLSTTRSDLSVTTSREVWDINSDMTFSASLPFAEVVYDAEGMIEDFVLNSELQDDFNPSVLPGYLFNSGNIGFGLDVGVDFRPMDKLQVSLSVVDLGYISWKDGVHQVSYATEYEFRGLEINPLGFSDDYTIGDHIDSTLTQLADSLSGFLEFSEGGSYAKRLNTKLYLGGSYQINDIINVGLLSRTDFLNRKLTEQVTATVGFKFGRIWNQVVSYSYMNGSYKNIGAGTSINLGPFNLYAVYDNLISALIWPGETRSVNLWFGLNLVFGYREKIDLPLIE